MSSQKLVAAGMCGLSTVSILFQFVFSLLLWIPWAESSVNLAKKICEKGKEKVVGWQGSKIVVDGGMYKGKFHLRNSD
jgi:hypothetical protein